MNNNNKWVNEVTNYVFENHYDFILWNLDLMRYKEYENKTYFDDFDFRVLFYQELCRLVVSDTSLTEEINVITSNLLDVDYSSIYDFVLTNIKKEGDEE